MPSTRANGNAVLKLFEQMDAASNQLQSECEKSTVSRYVLEKIIAASQDGIIVVDRSGCIFLMNPAFATMFGLKVQSSIGKTVDDIFEETVNATIRSALKQSLQQDTVTFELTTTTTDGSCADIECNLTNISNEQGVSEGSIMITKDVTARRDMETHLARTEKLRSLGQLAGGVAHDFNNVLTAIIGRAQILKRTLSKHKESGASPRVPATIVQDLDVIEKAATDGAETVRRIQQFSRAQSENSNFDPVDINTIIKDSIELTKGLWKTESESKGCNITIHQSLAGKPAILGKASELREVFINLIHNAVDAMPQGGTIGFTTYERNEKVVIEVSDTGIGIPAEIRERVFEPFFTTKGTQSTGLGISVSYGIISRHNGSFKLLSTQDKGTRFIITLPAVRRPRTVQKSAPVQDEYKKASILVIEDEEPVRSLLREILVSAGHSVTEASDGREGIEKIQENDFDMVFTDLGMPEVSGFQVARFVRQSRPSLPVVLTTGWGASLSEPEVRANGIRRVINKPYLMDSVLDTAREIMQGCGMSES